MRKILRRTLNICETVFKNENLIQTAILPEVVKSLGPVYPELSKNFKNIRETFGYENEYYKSARLKNQKEFKLLKIPSNSDLTEEDTIDYATFGDGYRDVENFLKSNPSAMSLPNDFLYDKLHIRGLPEELIVKIANEKNIDVDMDDFTQYKQEKKIEAKLKLHNLNQSFLDSIVLGNVSQTDYRYIYDYSFDSNIKRFNVKPITATVQLIQSDDENRYHIVLDKTNFYHTAGGQDGDTGKIIDANGNIFTVNSVAIHKGCVVHSGYFENPASDVFQPNQSVTLSVDSENRTGLSQHHTAMHLLQAAMKHVTGQILFQLSSHVTSNELKCELGSVGERIDLNKLAKIETTIQNVIQSKNPIETKFLMAHDLYALDNVTIIPGEIYPDENIRVLTMKDPTMDFVSIEPCCGTHAQNTADLEDFCFTSFKYSGGSYNVTAVTGSLVRQLRENEQHFLNKFECFKHKLNDDNSLDEWQCIESEAKELSKELADIQMPYITKSKITAEMEKIKKNIVILQKDQWRKIITNELTEVLIKRDQNKETCIIHALNTQDGLDGSLLDDAEQVCHDLPVMLLNISKNKIIHGRACIPTKYVTKTFNAQHWMKDLGNTLNIKCQPIKKKNQFQKCSFADIPDVEFSPVVLSEAMEKAKVRGEHAFNSVVLADQNERHTAEKNLIACIDELRANLNGVDDIDRLVEMDTRATNIRDDIKNNTFNYFIRTKCIAELIDINNELQEVRKKVMK